MHFPLSLGRPPLNIPLPCEPSTEGRSSRSWHSSQTARRISARKIKTYLRDSYSFINTRKGRGSSSKWKFKMKHGHNFWTFNISSQAVPSSMPRICLASCSVIALLALRIVFCIASCAAPVFEASRTKISDHLRLQAPIQINVLYAAKTEMSSSHFSLEARHIIWLVRNTPLFISNICFEKKKALQNIKPSS